MGNLDELLEEMLLKGYSKVISSEEKILKSLDGLGLKEFNTLDTIWELTKNKNNTSNNLAKVLGVTPGTITTNLDRLCEKGLVFKQKNDSLYGLIIVGERLDLGNPLGFIKSNIIAGLNDEKYSDELLAFMKSIVNDN